MNAFVKKFLKLDARCEVVKITGLPKSKWGYCIKNVDEFCKKIKSATPILAWSIVTGSGLTVANLHAVIEIKGKLRDITPAVFMETTRTIVREPRMTVARARELTQLHNNTFCDIFDGKYTQTPGIDFFDVI